MQQAVVLVVAVQVAKASAVAECTAEQVRSFAVDYTQADFKAQQELCIEGAAHFLAYTVAGYR